MNKQKGEYWSLDVKVKDRIKGVVNGPVARLIPIGIYILTFWFVLLGGTLFLFRYL